MPKIIQREDKRLIAARAAIVAASSLFAMVESSALNEECAAQLAQARTAHAALQKLLAAPLHLGRGRSHMTRLPSLLLPKSKIYAEYVGVPDRFKEDRLHMCTAGAHRDRSLFCVCWRVQCLESGLSS